MKTKNKSIQEIKIGVLGGGQLGRMMVQEATTWDLNISFLEKSEDFPVPSVFPKFVKGDFTNYEDVINFGKDKDVITIEIENVNIEALRELEAQGKAVYPQPNVLETIKDKGLQKAFYVDRNIPTSTYREVAGKDEIIQLLFSGVLTYPFVQKARTEGYDGKGVVAIKSEVDLELCFETASIVEELVDIDKELAVIVAKNPQGDICSFPVVEMVFNKSGNLLDYLICPSEITEAVRAECQSLAKNVITQFDMIGIMAVELFLTKEGRLLVNEVAPRAHNSGHHTINATNYSQYNIHLRAILGLPFPSGLTQKGYALMWNILGEKGLTGPAKYVGMESLLTTLEAYPHIYGKKITKPLRKMGHVNILGETKADVLDKLEMIRTNLKVIA